MFEVLYWPFAEVSGAERRGTTYEYRYTMYACARARAEVDARMDSQTRNCHAPLWPCRPPALLSRPCAEATMCEQCMCM